ncbi:bifunctional non-homologous end joining protein LigD [Pseudonocardia thermophila]|uniref:DNA ligase (ATP) n=1 Tax=Pseudonocardia thermophila TaxID=1848 RepID=A0A1M6SJ11_PSETH|nr:DNA ligase [Pseudonocardia thermophila]SHK44558.1 bifunctional non-homologous end joining protein LigD [Pseudonocardia thermophila]
MLATPGALPVGPDWLYEVMWDGIRVLAEVRTENGSSEVRLTTTDRRDITLYFPELADLAQAVPDIVLDGEIVVIERGVPSHAALTGRLLAPVPPAVAAARPATFMASDVLRLYGVDLTGRTLEERRATLERIDLGAASAVAVSPAYTDGAALMTATAQQGMAGVIAKRRSDPYEAGARSPGWVAVAHRRTTTCVVGGWVPDRGKIRALLVGVPDGDGLRYLGRVETGLAVDAVQHAIGLRLVSASASPFRDPLPRGSATGARWCTPLLVIEVAHDGVRPDGTLRGPVLRRIRDDVPPEGAGSA